MPSLRRAAWLVLAKAEGLAPAERDFVAALGAGSPGLVEAIELARAFGAMVRFRREEELTGWLSKATALARFADGLKRDIGAVRAALSLPWSTGPVEGQISRLKTIKRMMYGRAKFDLLRRRVLASAQ